MLSVPEAAAWCSQACPAFRNLLNIRYFVWPLLLLALCLLIIFDFPLFPYQLCLIFFCKTSDQLSKEKNKAELFSPLLTLEQ